MKQWEKKVNEELYPDRKQFDRELDFDLSYDDYSFDHNYEWNNYCIKNNIHCWWHDAEYMQSFIRYQKKYYPDDV